MKYPYGQENMKSEAFVDSMEASAIVPLKKIGTWVEICGVDERIDGV